MNVVHVFGAGSDVFRCDVATAEALDKTTVSSKNLLTVFDFVVTDYYRLAAAEVQSSHGVLVCHTARESQRVGDRLFIRRILPEARAAEGRTEAGAVDRKNAPVSNGRI